MVLDFLRMIHSFIRCKNVSQTSDELNRDLEKALLWAWEWKMHFIADKTEEKPPHPHLYLHRRGKKSGGALFKVILGRLYLKRGVGLK